MKTIILFLIMAGLFTGFSSASSTHYQEPENINKKDRYGETYLMNLSRDGRIAEMKNAISKGADVKIRTKYNLDAVVYAAMNGKEEAVKLLCNSGVDKNKVDISYVIIWGDSKLAELLVDLGCNPNYKGYTDVAPLLPAIRSGNNDLFMKLVEKGADLSVRGGDGSTALHTVIQNKNNTQIQFVLKQNIDVNLKNNDSLVALHFAAENRDYKLMQQLIDLGADVNAKDKNNATTAFRAALFNDIEMMKLLINNKADLTIESKWGTPLEYALKRKNKEMIKLIKNKVK